MNAPVLERATARTVKSLVVDCDIHPAMKAPTELTKFLPERWRKHMATYGGRTSQPFAGVIPYPRMVPNGGGRMDSYPPAGGPPASDLAFMREQHLDANDIEYGILQPLSFGSSTLDQDLGAAVCTAANEWQLDKWCGPEPRLKASLSVTQEDPDAAIAEIERRAGNRAFAQIAVPPRTIEPLGRRRYWKLWAAAVEHDLPIGIHSWATGPHTNSGSGWYSYYIEEHYAFAHSVQSVMTSMVMEGVFEHFPGLKVVLVEGGFAWVPSLAWRLDRNWRRMRDEVPHLKRPPSEYIREHFWFTTQPIEEPERPEDLHDVIRWIGADRLMFSTDYPHWDFDDPKWTFKVRLPEEQKQAIFRDNAKKLYKLD